MRLTPIPSYQGTHEYNSIRSEQLRGAQSGNGIGREERSGETVDARQEDNDAKQTAAGSRQKYTAYDYAKGYRPGINYELKGADSDINNLDVEKALSNLEKDKVLQQYQFFVGDRKASQGQEAALRSVENFSL